MNLLCPPFFHVILQVSDISFSSAAFGRLVFGKQSIFERNFFLFEPGLGDMNRYYL